MSRAVSGVVLAAGLSSRFDDGRGSARARPKQLLAIGGESLVRRTCRHALASGLSEVILVTGHARRRVEKATSDLGVRIVANPDYEAGQSGSVRCGLAAVADSSDGAMFVPIDQPALDDQVINRLLGAFAGEDSVVVPAYRGRRGAPVTFGRRWFPLLGRLEGDEGARPLLARLADRVREVELESARPLDDIDTPEEAAAWAAT